MPENDSHQQSLYIAAIAESLGYKGLISPVIDTREGIGTVFDFYYQEDDVYIKVFKRFDVAKYDKYVHHPTSPVVVFDSTGIDCKMESCACGCTQQLVVAKTIAQRIYDVPRVFIHAQGSLWEYTAHVDGQWIWTKRTPFVIRELMDSEDDDEDVAAS